jgi:Holliday junction resolvasome RuvABC endonuclease subunit
MKILSIDPGLHKCGVAILELDELGEIVILFVETIFTDALIKESGYIVDTHGERYARLNALTIKFKEILNLFNPTLVGSEIPFWNPKRPAAFEGLVTVLTTLENTVFQYDEALLFERVPAALVKKNLGVSGGSGDKSLVRTAILERNIKNVIGNTHTLDPDSIDAVAVGLYLCGVLNSIS